MAETSLEGKSGSVFLGVVVAQRCPASLFFFFFFFFFFFGIPFIKGKSCKICGGLGSPECTLYPFFFSGFLLRKYPAKKRGTRGTGAPLS